MREIATLGPLDRPAPSELGLWVADARSAYAVAEQLASTTFVPSALRGKPVDVMALMMAGQELGLRPMAAFRSIDIIQGTPALRAHAMRGLVQSHGHEVEIVESDDIHCVMRGRRTHMAAWQTVTWDLDRARKMDLLGRDQWKKQPRTMLIARATGELCRLIAADVLYAMPYATEELGDEPVRATATVTAAQLVAVPDGADRDVMAVQDFDAAEQEPLPPRMISGPQSRKLHAAFREMGLDRPSALAYCTDILHKTDPQRAEVGSTKELTVHEAAAVIDALEAEEKQPPQPAAEPDPWDAAVEAEQPELV